MALLAAGDSSEKQAGEVFEDSGPPRVAHLVPVPLPIAGEVDTRVKQIVDRVLKDLPRDGRRPLLIFEFRPKEGQAGEGSQFERSLSLARYLASDRLSRVRTVAYLPRPVKGHAVLAAMACEEIIIHPDAEFGAAGLNESFIEPTVLRGYSEIANRRRTIPTPVALGMLDKQLAVYKAQTIDGVRYVLADELEELQQQALVRSVETVIREGDMGLFSGRELRLKYGFASHLASDRNELAAALQLPPTAIEEDPSRGGQWRAIRADVTGPIDGKTVNWIMRSIDEKLRGSQANFLCLVIESPGGAVEDSVRLANYLAELDSSEVRTVAFVPYEARADAALLAAACDHLVMNETAILGGPGAKQIPPGQMADLRAIIQVIAKAKHRDWSLPVAMIDSQTVVYRYTRQRTGEVRYLCAEEHAQLDDSELWKRGGEVQTKGGIRGRQAEEWKLARYLASNFDELKQLYHLPDSFESVQPNWAHLLIEKLASPRIAGALLFVAWFTLMIEFMSPGLSVAGFISGLCFLLYFWSHFLHGTAGWLEVLLFVAGVACVALEIFVLPGMGAFGVGGGLLIVISLVLASQTFVIPRNAYHFEQLPNSLFMVVAGGAGAVISVVIMRRFLPDAPLFNRMMLPPQDEEQLEEMRRREALVDFNHLVGKRGVTTTQLTPSGKALFGDELVDAISGGELIPRGADVYVAEARGNHVLVRPIEDGEG